MLTFENKINTLLRQKEENELELERLRHSDPWSTFKRQIELRSNNTTLDMRLQDLQNESFCNNFKINEPKSFNDQEYKQIDFPSKKSITNFLNSETINQMPNLTNFQENKLYQFDNIKSLDNDPDFNYKGIIEKIPKTDNSNPLELTQSIIRMQNPSKQAISNFKSSKIAEQKNIRNSNRDNKKSVITNKTNTLSQSREIEINKLWDKKESAEKRLNDLNTRMHETRTDCIEEISEVSEELHQLEIELEKLIPFEVCEKPLVIIVPEIIKFPFGERAESISKSLKPVKIDDVTKLWDQWKLLDEQYPNTMNEFFIQHLRELITPFFSSIRYSSGQEATAGIDLEALEKIVAQVEDPFDLDTLTDPYRLECGHRLSKNNLDDLNNKCVYLECKVEKKAVEDTILSELIQLILHLNKE